MIPTATNCSSKGATAKGCLAPLLWEQCTPGGEAGVFLHLLIPNSTDTIDQIIDHGSKFSFSIFHSQILLASTGPFKIKYWELCMLRQNPRCAHQMAVTFHRFK